MENNDNEVIGIDFGTTYSCVGLYKNNKSEIVKNEIGNNTTPSIVYIDKDNNFVGEKARSYQLKNQLNTIYDIKRLIGKKYSDKNVQEEIKHLLYNVIENK
jgi:heat shock protein 5